MSLFQYALVFLCVLIVSTGQIMFKMAGASFEQGGPFLFSKGFWISGIAIAVYGAATIMWIYLLKTIPLSVAYPFMALSYVFVAIAAWLFFSETISVTYMVGIALIILGVTLTALRV